MGPAISRVPSQHGSQWVHRVPALAYWSSPPSVEAPGHTPHPCLSLQTLPAASQASLCDDSQIHPQPRPLSRLSTPLDLSAPPRGNAQTLPSSTQATHTAHSFTSSQPHLPAFIRLSWPGQTQRLSTSTQTPPSTHHNPLTSQSSLSNWKVKSVSFLPPCITSRTLLLLLVKENL